MGVKWGKYNECHTGHALTWIVLIGNHRTMNRHLPFFTTSGPTHSTDSDEEGEDKAEWEAHSSRMAHDAHGTDRWADVDAAILTGSKRR